MDEHIIDVSIPTDDDGFMLFQCPRCGEYFRISTHDLESEKITNIFCPLCGLTSDSFLTEDVENLAMAKAKNILEDELFNEFNRIKRKTNNSYVEISVSKSKKEEELPVRSINDNMVLVKLECCNRLAKVRYLLNYCGCFCPYCGGRNDRTD